MNAPAFLIALAHVAAIVRGWWARRCTRAGREARRRRERERELRACGLSRTLAKAAAQRLATGSAAPLHLQRPRDKSAGVAHNLSHRARGEPVPGAGDAAAGRAGRETPRQQRTQRDDRGGSPPAEAAAAATPPSRRARQARPP